MAAKSKGLNLPNILTLIRIASAPVIIALILIPWQGKAASVLSWVTAALFLLASLTDLLDGMIARGMNMVTDFGKFLDPIADKMLVLGTLIAMIGAERFASIRLMLVISTVIILLRELAITSIRMIAAKHDGTVISANIAGKMKTAFSIICLTTIMIEDQIFTNGGLAGFHLLSYITLAITVLLTVWSGMTYIRKYWSYIDPRK